MHRIPACSLPLSKTILSVVSQIGIHLLRNNDEVALELGEQFKCAMTNRSVRSAQFVNLAKKTLGTEILTNPALAIFVR